MICVHLVDSTGKEPLIYGMKQQVCGATGSRMPSPVTPSVVWGPAAPAPPVRNVEYHTHQDLIK